MHWSQSPSSHHHIEWVQAVASPGPMTFPWSMLTAALLPPHRKQLRYWGCKGGIRWSTWRWRILTSSARSRTVRYSVYVGRLSVWNLQLRQTWRGSNRFCAKRHPFCLLEPFGMTWCDHGTSSVTRDKLLFLLRYRGHHFQFGEQQ